MKGELSMNARKCMLVSLIMILGINTANMRAKAHTTFIPRSVTYDLTLELAMNNYWWYHDLREEESDRCFPFSFIISPFYMKSRNGCDLAPYFLPNDKTEISVQENGLGDVNSLWLQLLGPVTNSFDQKISISPERKAFGGYFNLNFDLSRWFDCAWFRIAFAAMRVSHNLNVRESQPLYSTSSGSGQRTALDVLNGSINNLSPLQVIDPASRTIDLLAGKWSRCALQRSGVDDIQLKLGRDWLWDCRRLSVYILGGIPTGQRPTAQYLFEPVVGSRHGAVGFGLDGEHIIWDDGNFNFVFMADFRYRYLFEGTECRSFDICPNGEFSRYLLLIDQATPSALLPGINTFTGSAKVTPRSTVDLWLAFHGQYCDWNLELGYNFWWRQREKVCFCQGLPNNIGVVAITAGGTSNGTTASTATIAQGPQGVLFNPLATDSALTGGTVTFVPLSSASSIDIDSATNPATVTNKLYAAISRNHTLCNREVLCGFAGSYEFASNSRASGDLVDHPHALEQIAFWFNLGINF